MCKESAEVLDSTLVWIVEEGLSKKVTWGLNSCVDLF